MKAILPRIVWTLLLLHNLFSDRPCFRSAMNAILLGTSSNSIQASFTVGSSRLPFTDEDSGAGISFSGGTCTIAPKSALNFEVNGKKKTVSPSLRPARSEMNLIQSEIAHSNGFWSSQRKHSRSSSPSITEEGAFRRQRPDMMKKTGEDGGLVLLRRKPLEFGVFDRVPVSSLENEVVPAEVEFSGCGIGGGRNIGGRKGEGRGGGGIGDFASNIGAYYQEMLKTNPDNPLLLRNYGKYLHEIEGEMGKAEECYERAILASPRDGEVLSLYAKLIWEKQRDEERAEAYFEQAVKASSDDCYVLGDYAHFLWDVEEDKEKNQADLAKSL